MPCMQCCKTILSICRYLTFPDPTMSEVGFAGIGRSSKTSVKRQLSRMLSTTSNKVSESEKEVNDEEEDKVNSHLSSFDLYAIKN